MTKTRAAALALVILTALGGLNTVLILKGQDENRSRASETHALAAQAKRLAEDNHSIAVNNCRNIATLAKVERAFINRQERQTQAILASGVTFGIPKEQLPKLIDASRKSQALFLRELDSLAITSCSAGGALTAPVVKPRKGKAHPKRSPSPGRVSSPGVRGGTTAAAPSSRTPSPRVVPEHRRVQVPSGPPAVAPPSGTTSGRAPPPPATSTTAPPPAPTAPPPNLAPSEPPPHVPAVPLPLCIHVGAVSVC